VKKLLFIVIFTTFCISCPVPAAQAKIKWQHPVTGEIHDIARTMMCDDIDKAIEKIDKWGHTAQHMAEECGYPTEKPECVAEWGTWHYMSQILQALEFHRALAGCTEH
jgi:hypothetical protein